MYKNNLCKDVITVLTDGYDVSYGARSVKHETERKVVSKLAKAFEDGTLKKDMKIVMCCDLPENVQGIRFETKITFLKSTNDSDIFFKSSQIINMSISSLKIKKQIPSCKFFVLQ